MYDCVNVEMRELLPDLMHGRLDAATRARVDEHLLVCAECAAELDALRGVRAALSAAPSVDVSRIVRALPRPAAVDEGSIAGPRRPAAAPVRRWVDWRIAAAVSAITIGGLSLAVTQRSSEPGARGTRARPAADSGIVARGTSDDVPNANPPTVLAESTPPRTDVAAPRISFGGGVSDLDPADMRELLGALDEIDAAPVAPAAEPDRAPLLPTVREEGT